jgi:hypothetical protein
LEDDAVTHSTISVSFIDDSSSATLAMLDLPIANLPDTFERETSVHRGDDDWTAVSAQPRTRLEFVGSVKLI